MSANAFGLLILRYRTSAAPLSPEGARSRRINDHDRRCRELRQRNPVIKRTDGGVALIEIGPAMRDDYKS